jgi:hypothetical protein
LLCTTQVAGQHFNRQQDLLPIEMQLADIQAGKKLAVVLAFDLDTEVLNDLGI